MRDKGVLCRRMQFPTESGQDVPLHLFNVFGTKLSSTEVRQSVELDFLAVMELDRDVQRGQRS